MKIKNDGKYIIKFESGWDSSHNINISEDGEKIVFDYQTWTYIYVESFNLYGDGSFMIEIVSYDEDNNIYQVIDEEGNKGTIYEPEPQPEPEPDSEYFYTNIAVDTLNILSLILPNVNDVVPKIVLDLLFSSGITIDILLTGNLISINKSEPEPEYFYTKNGVDTLKTLSLISPNVNDVVPKFVLDLLFASGITIDILLTGSLISINKSESEPEPEPESESEIIIDLNEGWNLIGSSYNGTLEDSESIIILNTIYEYDTSYKSTTEIKKNKGYWIKASKSGKIKLKYNE